jgi:hypothetical protein
MRKKPLCCKQGFFINLTSSAHISQTNKQNGELRIIYSSNVMILLSILLKTCLQTSRTLPFIFLLST